MLTIEKKKNFIINFAFFAAIIALVYFVFKFLLGYLMPFVIAVAVAVLAQKPARFFNKKYKIKRSVVAIIFVVMFYIVLLGVVGSICYFLYNQLYGFFSDLPNHIPDIKNFFDGIKDSASHFYSKLPKALVKYFDELPAELIGSVTKSATSSLSKFASSAVMGTPEFTVSILVTFVATCYLACDYDKITKYILDHSSKKIGGLIKSMKSMTSSTLLKLFKGYFLLMIITFVELVIALSLLGVKYSVVIAALIAIIDVLPILGTGTVLIPWGIICLIQGNVARGIIILAVYIVIALIRNFLEPKIIGDKVGLYPIITLFSMFCGLKLFGVLGMLLTPVLVIICINFYRNRKGKLNGIAEENTQTQGN